MVFRSIFSQALDLVLPHRCALCDAPNMAGQGLCGTCFPKIEFIPQPACPGCARPLDNTIAGKSAVFCGTCLRDGPMFDHAVAALNYGDGSASLIQRLKHGDRLDLAPLLAGWMSLAWDQSCAASDLSDGNGNDIDYIVPVPLHRWRLVTRRYNQSLVLAQHLPDTMPGRLTPNLLVRRKNTPQMKNLNRSQRLKNVAGAFEVSQRFRADSDNLLRGKHVLLVDDVFTTGATLRAIARTLRRAQVQRVSILVTARVTRSDL